MLAMPGMRGFAVSAAQSADGVSCNAQGVFVGPIPLLERIGGRWMPRRAAELNDELTACYRLPIDIATKANALSLIAHALNRGDLAMAAIAAVQMQIPDPPLLAKRWESPDDVVRRARELARSGLLKADWDPTKHPRTGTKPNPGWFALVPKEPTAPSVGPTGPKVPRSGWPQANVNREARALVRGAARFVTRNAGRLLLLGVELNVWIEAIVQGFTPSELNQGEDRLIAQLTAALQPFPKSLEELQQPPTDDALGWEPHHIVAQNEDNLAKMGLVKFGRDRIDDPSNIVWLPRFLHEQVSAEYSSNSNGPGTPLVRDIINQMDFGQQREEGLKILHELGILK